MHRCVGPGPGQNTHPGKVGSGNSCWSTYQCRNHHSGPSRHLIGPNLEQKRSRVREPHTSYQKPPPEATNKKKVLRGLMWKNFVHISIEANTSIKRDQYRFFNVKDGKDVTNKVDIV